VTELPATFTATRDELVDALTRLDVRVPVSGPAAGMINAESMADAIIEARRAAAGDAEMVAVPKYDFEGLLAVATLYVEMIPDDAMMTLPEKMRLQEIEDIVERYGKRY
jgi:hypothetical protein